MFNPNDHLTLTPKAKIMLLQDRIAQLEQTIESYKSHFKDIRNICEDRQYGEYPPDIEAIYDIVVPLTNVTLGNEGDVVIFDDSDSRPRHEFDDEFEQQLWDTARLIQQMQSNDDEVQS